MPKEVVEDTEVVDEPVVEEAVEDEAEVEAEPEAEAEESEEEKPAKAKLFMSKADRKATEAKNAEKAAAKQKTIPSAIKDTLRSKIKTDVLAEVNADPERSWGNGIGKEEGTRLRAAWELSRSNPIEFLHQFATSIHNSRHKDDLLRYFNSIGLVPKGSSEAAGVKSVADTDPMPQLVPDAQGIVSPAAHAKYAKDMNEWQQRNFLKAVDERMKPVMQDRQHNEQAFTERTNSESYANRTIAGVFNRPGFQENKDAIVAAYTAMPRPWLTEQRDANGFRIGNINHPQYREEETLLLDAYHQITAQKNTEIAQKKWIADQRKKAGINTVSGAGPSGGTTKQKKPASFKEAVRAELKSGKYRF